MLKKFYQAIQTGTFPMIIDETIKHDYDFDFKRATTISCTDWVSDRGALKFLEKTGSIIIEHEFEVDEIGSIIK